MSWLKLIKSLNFEIREWMTRKVKVVAAATVNLISYRFCNATSSNEFPRMTFSVEMTKYGKAPNPNQHHFGSGKMVNSGGRRFRSSYQNQSIDKEQKEIAPVWYDI